ncbi:MAG: hypothetical protein IT378_27285 [Sandaracinaceae bacterium]|nr:hypothetical protein [Sandaracinaceae bacterium]
MRPQVVLLTCALLCGCGARSSLSEPEVRDAGPVPDGFVPDGGGALAVECGSPERLTAPRRPITVEASAASAEGVVRAAWSLVSSPPASMPRFTDHGDRTATLTPDVEGEFRLRFEAEDGAGRRASCEVMVRAVVGPPVALCPAGEQRTAIDAPIVLSGDGFDDEMIVAFEWSVASAPPGAVPSLEGADTPMLLFRTSTRGRYRLRLTVYDTDMASNSCEVEVLVTGPPEVACPPARIEAPTRRPVTISARATDDVGIASREWQVLMRPAGSTAAPRPPDADTTSFTPDRRGEYRLRFTVRDVEGFEASCDVTVIGTPTPPEVTCPEVVTTPPLREVTITASAVDDGRIVRWRWQATEMPMGSRAAAPRPADQPQTRFTPDIAGIYRLTVTATDDDGMTGTCTTRVEAGNVDGLRVEVFWDTDGTDMDTHLLNPTATRWVNEDDCYYGNCTRGPVLEWGAPGTADNPRLDIDDTNGFGPENINIERPQSGTYRVGVHCYGGRGLTTRVTVRVYCGGSTTTPRQTFGPVALRDNDQGNDFWRVADVAIDASGCRITDLAQAGRPNIITQNQARMMR